MEPVPPVIHPLLNSDESFGQGVSVVRKSVPSCFVFFELFDFEMSSFSFEKNFQWRFTNEIVRKIFEKNELFSETCDVA